MALNPGTRLGPYEIVAPLGAGGMGEVYKAVDTRLGRTVAVKVLPESLASNADFRARFESEAKAISSLSHPHICALYDIGKQQGIDYLVLEYLEGTTLAERLKRSRFSAVDIAKIGIQIADALKAAHSKGIIHRDIKPANIFVNAEGMVKVLDFGVAKVSTIAVASGNEMTAMTIPGDTMGTVAYMSPEQALGKPVDARSDLFSLGAVLYEMATGARAFSGDSTVEIFDAILHKEPVAVARLAPVVPAELDHIVSKALEKDPELRFQTAAEMLSELKRLNRDASSTTVRTVPAQRRSGAKLWGSVAAAIVVLGAATTWWFLRERSGATGASTEQVTIAVLPFQNIGAGKELDFLQVALPDEITTALSYAPGIAIRPFGNLQKFNGEGVNAQSAGKELRVSNVVTGHFLRNANELQLTLEAIDVDNNKIVWRDTFSFLAGDLKAIQDRVLVRVRQGLLPLLGVTQVGGPGTRPKNEEAYNLFLRASATPHDPTPNKQAIAMLERSVALDPNYAPAWSLLGTRYDYDSSYSDGGDTAKQLSNAAFAKAVALDPNLESAAASLAQSLSDMGQLNAAYDRAIALVRQRPDSARAHHTLGYVLRYAGATDEAGRECNVAKQRDPFNYEWRSCANAFMLASDYKSAREFIALDAGSHWAGVVTSNLLLREGKREDAAAMIPNEAPSAALVKATVRGEPQAKLATLTQEWEARTNKITDPEIHYWNGGFMAAMGQREAALRMLRYAAEKNYCAYPAIESDPLLTNLASEPEFAAIKQEAKRCRERFEEHRKAVAPAQ